DLKTTRAGSVGWQLKPPCIVGRHDDEAAQRQARAKVILAIEPGNSFAYRTEFRDSTDPAVMPVTLSLRLGNKAADLRSRHREMHCQRLAIRGMYGVRGP